MLGDHLGLPQVESEEPSPRGKSAIVGAAWWLTGSVDLCLPFWMLETLTA